MTWQPLSVRRGLKPPTALQGGVPAHLLPHVLGWISKSLGGESNAGAMARRANISYVALLNHIQVRDSGDSLDALNTILLQCRLDQDLCLDVLDCLLRFELGDAEDLDLLLAVGASTWKVAPDRRSLTSRVDPTVEEALSAATSPEDAASAELREAWTRAYGRERDPSDAWDHAIKAVEALLRPIVSPKDSGATLGKMLSALRAKPSKWQFPLESDKRGGVETFTNLLELIWPNPDRHGGQGPAPTQQQAEAVVQAAVLAVQWMRAGALGVVP